MRKATLGRTEGETGNLKFRGNLTGNRRKLLIHWESNLVTK